VITATPLAATTATFVGADGGIDGVTALLALEFGLVPQLFVAVTAKVYLVPFVRPLSVHRSTSGEVTT
jgi:hypothetical protein